MRALASITGDAQGRSAVADKRCRPSSESEAPVHADADGDVREGITRSASGRHFFDQPAARPLTRQAPTAKKRAAGSFGSAGHGDLPMLERHIQSATTARRSGCNRTRRGRTCDFARPARWRLPKAFVTAFFVGGKIEADGAPWPDLTRSSRAARLLLARFYAAFLAGRHAHSVWVAPPPPRCDQHRAQFMGRARSESRIGSGNRIYARSSMSDPLHRDPAARMVPITGKLASRIVGKMSTPADELVAVGMMPLLADVRRQRDERLVRSPSCRGRRRSVLLTDGDRGPSTRPHG